MSDRHRRYIRARKTSQATGNPVGKVYANSVRKPNLEKIKPTKVYVDTMPTQLDADGNKIRGSGDQRKLKAFKQFGPLAIQQEYITGQSPDKRNSYLFNKTAATLDIPVGSANVQLHRSKSTDRNKLRTSADMISKYKKYGIPDVQERQTIKADALAGKVAFPVGDAKVALFGSKTTTKGNQSSGYGNFQNSFKNIERQLGANIGYKISENDRLGLDINKKWFNKQKTGSNVELDYSTEFINGQLHVTLGKYEDGQIKDKALQLRYSIPTNKLMRFFK